ncbi:hypothetical protein NHX12_021702 [Muraenolepis orangiensis]|uniref:Uncharacterized protein n=1 Tax=Muraenolepis orangiensis TaxID=630683 RepID=A0A9Q0EU73_9TELE|nr:hypothetical protein NHX12_021702 [Muraenolepis orangiensis]
MSLRPFCLLGVKVWLEKVCRGYGLGPAGSGLHLVAWHVAAVSVGLLLCCFPDDSSTGPSFSDVVGPWGHAVGDIKRSLLGGFMAAGDVIGLG